MISGDPVLHVVTTLFSFSDELAGLSLYALNTSGRNIVRYRP